MPLLSVPLLRQRDRTDCLPTCVEMVVAYFGQTVSPDWLRQALEATDIGTPGFKSLRLRHYGYDVTYIPATDERPLVEALNAGIPPIALILTRNLSYWRYHTAHAVVVIELDPLTVTLNDPAFPDAPRQVPYDEFMLAWSDYDQLYAIVRPPIT